MTVAHPRQRLWPWEAGAALQITVGQVHHLVSDCVLANVGVTHRLELSPGEVNSLVAQRVKCGELSPLTAFVTARIISGELDVRPPTHEDEVPMAPLALVDELCATHRSWRLEGLINGAFSDLRPKTETGAWS